jgi:HEPN domain-containing protein
MKPPEEQVRGRLVAQWLGKAATDQQAAEALLSRDPPLLYPSCFFSQQAAEKNLKALLTHHNVEFPKTHVIGELLDLLARVDAPLALSIAEATALSPYGVEVRYPGDMPEPSVSEAQEALRLAELVREAVLAALGRK